MNSFEEPAEESGRGLSRRQLLCRIGGGIAGALLASAGLEVRWSYGASPGPISLRDLLGRISAQGCDASHGIRPLVPNDHPVISIRDVARRYAGNALNLCRGPEISVQTDLTQTGGYITTTGSNFTPRGTVHIQFEGIHNVPGAYNGNSLSARADGTFEDVFEVTILPLEQCPTDTVVVRAIDVQRGMSATGTTDAFHCPR